MLALVIKNNEVVNIIEVESLSFEINEGTLAAAVVDGIAVASIGDLWDGEKWVQPTIEPTQDAYEDAAQRYLDGIAIQLGYDNIVTAASYADEPEVPKFQSDGIKLRKLRSRVWKVAYEVLAQAQHGLIPVPTVPQFVAMLPSFE